MLTNSHYDFFARSGFDVLSDEPGHWGYAKRLSRYITDPSTVRVRTIEQFGIAPPVDVIRTMRAEWLATIKRRAHAIATYGMAGERRRAEERSARVTVTAPKRGPVLRLVQPTGVMITQPDPTPVAAKGFLLHTATEVIDACADACGVSHGELIGTMRQPEYTRARNLCAAVLRARGNSLSSIGRLIGDRDHSTILNSIRRFFARDIEDEHMLAAWNALAPCVSRACRSLPELSVVSGVRQ